MGLRDILERLTNLNKHPASAEPQGSKATPCISGDMPATAIISLLSDKGCCDVTGQLDIDKCDENVSGGGGFGDIYRGALRDGSEVAIKCPRLFLKLDKNEGNILKDVAQEIYVWSKLKHENVLALIGLATFQNRLSIVSSWMSNGTVLEYVTHYPTADRYNLCLQMAAGLKYLHSSGVVHGDLKGLNVLISSSGTAKLADFGSSMLKELTSLQFSGTKGTPAITPRWAAPELVFGGGTHSEKSDIYALGVTFLETVTGQIPFSDKSDLAIYGMLAIKETPELPTTLNLTELPEAETLREMMLICRAYDPAHRPDASRVYLALEEAFKLRHSRLSPPPARPNIVIISRRTLDSEVISYLVDHGVSDVTSELDLAYCTERPIAAGGFGDVYQGQLFGARKIAIKCPRIFLRTDEGAIEVSKAMAREIYTWSKFRHPNILELIGLAKFRGQISIVSPWLENGTLPRYLNENPQVDRFQLCLQIASGLAYLHKAGTVHGSVKGTNILVSQEGIAKLIDFGNALSKNYTIQFTGEADNSLSLRWAAPELFNGSAQTKAADVYALGMTFLEIITGDAPYRELSRDLVVMTVIMRGEIPERPQELAMIGEHKGNVLWEAAVECWNREADSRPNASEVERKLSMLEV